MTMRMKIVIFIVVVIIAFMFFHGNSIKTLNTKGLSSNYLWKEATKSDKPLFMYFYADRCGTCRRIKPTINAVAKEFYYEYTFMPVNVDDRDNNELSWRFNVRTIPKLFLVNHLDGKYKKLNLSLDAGYYKKELDDFFLQE